MQRTINNSVTIVLLSLIVIPSQSVSGVDYSFTDVDFPEAKETVLYGINNLGVVVGEYGDIDFTDPLNVGNKGFVFDGQSFRTIDVPESVSTSARGINDAGHVVGEYIHESGQVRGFLYDGATYSDIIVPFGADTSAADINNAGLIVGGYSSDAFTNDLHGFRFDGTTYEMFNYPRALQTVIDGVNDAGQQVGTFITPISADGFLIPGFTKLTHPNGLVTRASGINDEGLVVGTYTALRGLLDASFEGFIYDSSNESFTDIDLPGPDCTFNALLPSSQCMHAVRGINSAQTIVGYYDNDDGEFHGFIGTLPQLLQAGDADQDLDFDQLDLVQVQIHAKYLTGEPATWGEGDWNGAPGGRPGDPPRGNGLFDQLDIVAALSAATYLTGPYAASRSTKDSALPQTANELIAVASEIERGHTPVVARLQEDVRISETADREIDEALEGQGVRNSLGVDLSHPTAIITPQLENLSELDSPSPRLPRDEIWQCNRTQVECVAVPEPTSLVQTGIIFMAFAFLQRYRFSLAAQIAARRDELEAKADDTRQVY